MPKVSRALMGFAMFTLFTSFVKASPWDDGNRWGAAQVCGLPTTGLPYSNDGIFLSALQTALRSRQDCGQIANSLRSVQSFYPGQNSFFNAGYSTANFNQFDYGNLWGAAQVCGFPTTGIPYSNDRTFQSALQVALRSRQDCGQIANSLRSVQAFYPGQNAYSNPGYDYRRQSFGQYDYGNLWGAAQVCGFPTTGIPYSNDRTFQSALQVALRSRQDCGQIANSLRSVQAFYPGQSSNWNRGRNNFSYGRRDDEWDGN